MLVSLQTSFTNEPWQRLERRLASKGVFKMLLKHSKTASRPPGSLQYAPKMLQRCLQEVSKTSKNSSKLHHVCYSCFNRRQGGSKTFQDGIRTVQDGSKISAKHLKTFLNAYNALSRGVVHLLYYTQACATPSFGSRVISFPSTQ